MSPNQGCVYESLHSSVQPELCADLVLGLDFQSHHESVTFNYVPRYLTVYFAQRQTWQKITWKCIEPLHPTVFSVQLSSSSPFGRTPVDQATEVTLNKDTQTAGGTSGFSLKPAAVQRYYITSE